MAVKQSPSALLKRLEAVRETFGEDAAAEKLALLKGLARRRLPTTGKVLRLHEALLFLRAYPDDEAVLDQTERMLRGFARRGDLKRHRAELADSGIAGTTTFFRFYWFMARWLAHRCPDRLHVDWAEFENREKLVEILHLLLPYCETPALDRFGFFPKEWIDLLKGPEETDAAFLVRRFESLVADPWGRETFYEQLDIPMRLEPGPHTPSRTLPRYRAAPIVFQTRPLDRSRPNLGSDARRPPEAVRSLPPHEGREMIDLALEAMVPRNRDLDVFVHADPKAVRLVDCGDGLQFACLEAVPERRLLLESVYGFLTLKNGVPTGYVLLSSLFGSSEVAYNVFDTWRGGESARIYGRVLAMARHLFGSDVFAVDPYQLGHDNAEGLASGAWWFYYKLGFRPDDPGVRRLVRRELAHMKRDPRHRSSISTLQKLTAETMFLDLEDRRGDVLGRLDVGNVGLAVAQYLAGRFGADREAGIRTCAEEAADLLGPAPSAGFTRAERLAWERWGPLVAILPGVKRWSAAERRALARVIRAKGGRYESDFVRLFDRHRRLRRAVAELAGEA